MATIELEDAFADDSLEMDEVGDKFRVAADLQARIVATGPITSAPPSQITVTPAATGAATETARADHVHDVAVATPTALTVGGSNAAGTSTALARADHKHALPAFGSPVAEAIGSAAADGVATTFARADHVHAMPNAGAPAALAIGSAQSAGAAATLARSDHVHALPDAGAPAALPVGGSSQAGNAGTLARSDHVHGLPAFGSAAGTFCEGNDARLAAAGGLKNLTTIVSTAAAAAPVAGQALIASANNAAVWQNPPVVDPSINGFRLAPTADDSIPADGAFSTIYLAPVESDLIALFDGTAWFPRRPIGAVSYALAGRTADMPFDVFASWNGSTVVLSVLNWASATARATAISRVSGVWSRQDSVLHRYLGTVRPRSATTYRVQRSSLGPVPIGIDYWNVSNKRQANIAFLDTGGSHSYTTEAWRQWANTTNAQIEVVQGLAGDAISINALGLANTSNATTVRPATGIGVNSVVAASGASISPVIAKVAATSFDTAALVATFNTNGLVGATTYTWLEWGAAGVLFFGGVPPGQSGIFATLWY